MSAYLQCEVPTEAVNLNSEYCYRNGLLTITTRSGFEFGAMVDNLGHYSLGNIEGLFEQSESSRSHRKDLAKILGNVLLGKELSIEEFCLVYFSYLQVTRGIYQKPPIDDPAFFNVIQKCTGQSPESFFGWGNVAKVTRTEVGISTRPLDTMALDYAIKGWGNETGPYFNENRLVYQAFLHLFTQIGSFRDFISRWLEQNQNDGYATHPDFVGIVLRIHPELSQIQDLEQMKIELEQLFKSEDGISQLENIIKKERVYTSTSGARLAGVFADLIRDESLGFGTVQAVVDIGSGEYCLPLTKFVDQLPSVSNVIAIDPLSVPIMPINQERCVRFVGFRGGFTSRGLASIGIMRDASDALIKLRDSGADFCIINTNVLMPHFSIDTLMESIGDMLRLSPSQIILGGGLYDLLNEEGEWEMHVIVRVNRPNKKNSQYPYGSTYKLVIVKTEFDPKTATARIKRDNTERS